MRYPHPGLPPRPGLVALELALLLPLLLILLFGIWDVGRMVEVQQVMNNAAREGARQAAIGMMLDPTTGGERDIHTTDIQQTVVNYLSRNGLSTAGLAVQFADLNNPAALDPYQAQHLDHLRVTVQLPAANVRFILVNNFTNTNSATLTTSADWLSLKDSNVAVSTSLPTN